MIYCPGCGTANREGSRYCNQCGGPLTEEAALVCPRCGTANAPRTAHCQGCGLDLARMAGRDEVSEGELWRRGLAGEGGAGEAADGEPAEGGEAASQVRGLPPWLDSVEWPGEEPALWARAVGDLDLGDERYESRAPRYEWSADAIPIEPIVGVPYRARERPEPPVPAGQQPAAELLREVAAEGVRAVAQEVAGPPTLRGLEPGLRWLANVALLLAVLVPLVWPLGPLTAAGDVPASVIAAEKAVGGLPPGAIALVAFEYDAGLAGELQPIAEAFLHQLLSRRVRVLTISTRPEGAALAEMALDRLAPAYPDARYAHSYLHLGYVAGGEAALRALAIDVRAAVPVTYGGDLPEVAGARELPLIVVVGRDLLAVQRWIEQIGAPYGTPLVAGVPALVEPAIGPYWAAGQLQGVVAGVGGAAAYERLAARPGTAGAMLGAVRTGAWVVGGLVVLVNLAGLLHRARKWRK